MGIKKYTAYTPSRRKITGLDFEAVTTDKPEKSLLASKKKTAGRNNQGIYDKVIRAILKEDIE